MKKRALYLSSPYRSKTEWGVFLHVVAAHTYAKMLWQTKRWAVFSPVSNTAFMGELDDFDDWMDGDLEFLSRCDAWVGAPGWEKSRGCRIEYDKARECGLEILTLEEALK